MPGQSSICKIVIENRYRLCDHPDPGAAMWNLLDKIQYPILIGMAAFMLLAPFTPMPHVLEKLIMLKSGTLTRPVDIFDLFFHLIPSVALVLKVYRQYRKKI
jgi:hypothetical protein